MTQISHDNVFKNKVQNSSKGPSHKYVLRMAFFHVLDSPLPPLICNLCNKVLWSAGLANPLPPSEGIT